MSPSRPVFTTHRKAFRSHRGSLTWETGYFSRSDGWLVRAPVGYRSLHWQALRGRGARLDEWIGGVTGLLARVGWTTRCEAAALAVTRAWLRPSPQPRSSGHRKPS